MTHWTELPQSVFVHPDTDRPNYIVNACPKCKSTDWQSKNEWGYYERVGRGICNSCNTEFLYYG